ncbi:hypothetical protein [Gracilibacillus lacisalsi]|uniref:hypothetical protein n=1 Tax=Gracilibacillus lacisalsi TaxID=393087 RepID=UPI000365E650|nr:hypothetical protein [Gracilibacillus lacisalsi]
MKKILPLFLLIFIALPVNVFAAGITSSEYNSSEDIYYVYLDLSGVDTFTITQDSTGASWDYETVPGTNYTTLTCNGSFTYTFYDSSGTLLATDSVTASGIQEQNSACEDEPDDSTGGNDSGDNSYCGCIFRTPGWEEYLDKIDDVIGAIPPAPNWGNVADTFRDSIVPSLIGGIENMLGSPPGQMSAPGYPSDLDDGNLQEPTGQEDPGLEGFDDSDIKGQAPDVEFREDESGGFDIDNPIDAMPEQEVFEPEEPENPRPEDPEEPENPTPTPEEPENPIPGEPEEPENPAPTPSEPDNPAPVPEEGDNPTPIPEEGENETPTPGETEGSFPIPGDSEGGYPMLGENSEGFPMP